SQSKGFDGPKSAAVLKEKEPTVLTETAVDFAEDMAAGETNVEFEGKVLAKPSRSRLIMPGKSSGNREKGGRKDTRTRFGGDAADKSKLRRKASRSTHARKTVAKKTEAEPKSVITDRLTDSEQRTKEWSESQAEQVKSSKNKGAEKESPEPQSRQAEAEESDGKAAFRNLPVNPFVMTGKDRLSTFAMDTDTASYSIARNFLNRGQLPPPGAIRMEEFINAFDYNYPAPKERTFSIFTEGAPSPFGNNLELIKVGIQGRVIGRANRKRANLVFVIDTSGSMAQPDRLPLVKESLKLLVEQLNEDDWVTLITYGTRPRLILDSERAAKAEKIKNTIDSLQTGGSTNLFSGVKLGYEAAARSFRSGGINRIILCSDGAANVGPADSEKLLASVRAFRRQGITFTSAGFGLGTYNDDILEQLANKGDGTYLFIDSLEEARQVFVEQLAATLQYIAKDAKIQVEFDPSRVRRYRLIGYENRDIADDKFRDDTIDAGEVGSGQSVTALYEIELQPQLRPISQKRPATLGTVYIRYRDLNSDKIEEFSRHIKSTCLKKRTPQEDPRFFLAACTAEMAEILRHSEYASHGNMKDVEYYLEKVAGKLPVDKKVRELLKLVRTAKSLLGEQ
ncbi:MAG: von Willebrand factor type A domain-containing protein, partial [Lentisphaeria bacterium]